MKVKRCRWGLVYYSVLRFQAGGRADRPAFYYSIKMNIKRLNVSVLTIMRLNVYNRHTVKQE